MMKKEQDEAIEDADADFKALILANNPPLYQELFAKNPVDENQVEFLVPESPGQLADMMAQLKEMGVNATLDPTDNDFSRFRTHPLPEPEQDSIRSSDSSEGVDSHTALSNQDIE